MQASHITTAGYSNDEKGIVAEEKKKAKLKKNRKIVNVIENQFNRYPSLLVIGL